MNFQSSNGTASAVQAKKRATIITFVSQKGGTGKTTIAQNLAICLALHHGKRVLGVDLDPQGCYIEGLTKEPVYTTKTTDCLLLVPKPNVLEYIVAVRPNLDVIPNNFQKDLRESVERMAFFPDLLMRQLSAVQTNYDYIFVDTPAGLARSTQIGIDAADEIVIVLSCGKYALKGASAILDWVSANHSPLKPSPTIKVILNNYDERRRFDRKFKEEIQYIFGEDLYETHIHSSIRVTEATAEGVSIIEKDKSHVCTTDFKILSHEVLGLPLDIPLAKPNAEIKAESGTAKQNKGVLLKLVS